MQITRVSALTGVERTKDLPITEEQYELWATGEGLIQHIMPDLPAGDREFLKTGITDEEWNAFLKDN